MGLSQIDHMDIVADWRAIGGVIVLAKDRKALARAKAGLAEKRDQMGLRHMAFTDLAVRISPCRIEIAQRRPAEGMGLTQPAQGPLKGQFRGTVRIDRHGGVGLWDQRNRRDAVNRRR